jgi:chromosome segregation ATPase
MKFPHSEERKEEIKMNKEELESKIVKLKNELEPLEEKKKKIEERIKEKEDKLTELNNQITQIDLKEIEKLLGNKGLSFEDIKGAILKGDLSEVQAKLKK